MQPWILYVDPEDGEPTDPADQPEDDHAGNQNQK